MTTGYSTLELVRSNPDAFKGWGVPELTTNRYEVRELDRICALHDIQAKILVYFDQNTLFEYKRRYY